MLEQFQAAVTAGDDTAADALATQLTTADQPDLLRMAAASDPEQIWWGVRGLANVGDAEAVPALVERLHHPDSMVRAAAVLALGHIHPRAADTVNAHLADMAALLGDEDDLVRQTAVTGLALCGDAAVETLAECLHHGEGGVQVRAAAALHRIGTRKVALPLYHHLEDPNPLVRHYAFETLDSLGLLTNVLLGR